MIRSLAARRTPLRRASADDVHRRVMAAHEHRLDLRRITDLRAQLQRRRDGALRVILGGPELDARPQNHEVAPVLHRERLSSHELFKTKLTLENRRRSAHPLASQQRREDPASCGMRDGTCLPMRKLPDARLPQRCARHARDVHSLLGALRIEPHQVRRGKCAGKRDVRHMVPSARTQADRVAHAALDFVGEGDGRDQIAPGRAFGLRHRECRGDVVARVRGFLREIRVVEIEIPHEAAIRERRPIRRYTEHRAEDGRAASRRKSRRRPPRDRARLGIPRAESAAERIHDPPFHLMHHRRRQCLEAEAGRKVSEPLGERAHCVV